MTDPQELIARLGLEEHPEGGWYRRTWTATGDTVPGEPATAGGQPASNGDGRAAGSSILYLLPPDTPSRWHRIDAEELWHHAAGDPLEVSRWREGDPGPRRARLGSDLLAGDGAQVVVEPGEWQSARSLGAWSLVVCVVVPEFRFEGFEPAPEGWAPPTSA